MVFSRTNTNSSIGLDIGRSTIKAIQLQKREDGKIGLLAYGVSTQPNKKAVDSVLHPHNYHSLLANLLQTPNFGTFIDREFVVSLPSRHTYIQHNVPSDMFVQQANKKLGTTIEDLLINTHKYNESNSVSIATAQNIFQPHFDTLNAHGLVIQTDHEITAAIRSINTASRQTLFVGLGAYSTTIGIYNSYLISAENVEFGTHHFIDNLSQVLNLTFDQAKELLFNFGFLPSSVRIKIIEVSKDIMAEFIKTLHHIIDYVNPDNIILYGGGASIPGIADYLQIEFKIPVTVGNPWQRIGKYPLKPLPRKVAPMFATAIGLAILGLE